LFSAGGIQENEYLPRYLAFNALLPKWKLLTVRSLADCQEARGWPSRLVQMPLTSSNAEMQAAANFACHIRIGFINLSAVKQILGSRSCLLADEHPSVARRCWGRGACGSSMDLTVIACRELLMTVKLERDWEGLGSSLRAGSERWSAAEAHLPHPRHSCL
jgi:hypothetical protein